MTLEKIQIDSEWLKIGFILQRNICIFIAAATGLYHFLVLKTDDVNLLTIYIFLGIWGCTFALSTNPFEKLHLKISTKNWIIVGAVFFIATLIKIYFNSWIPVKGDEILQFVEARNLNAIAAAFKQQQPPMAYYFSGLAEYLFGTTPIALRVFTHLFSGFIIVMFFVILKTLRFRTINALSSCVVLFLTPFIFNYFIESRPYAYALLFLGFVVFEIILNFQFFKAISASAVRFCAVAFLFLLTIGFQAPLLVGVFAMFSIGGYFLYRRSIKVFLSAFVGFTGSLLFLIPIERAILSKSLQYIRNSESMALDLWANFENFFSWKIFFGLGLVPTTIFFISVCGFFVFKSRTKKSNEKKDSLFYAQIFFLIAVVFIFISAVVFSYSINRDFKERYFIVGTYLLCLSLVIFLNQISERFFVAFVSILFVLTMLKPHWIYQRRSVKSPVAIVLDEIKSSDYYLPICPMPLECWEHVYEVDYYSNNYKKIVGRNLLYPRSNVSNELNKMSNADRFYLFLVYPKELNIEQDIDGLNVIHSQAQSVLLRFEGAGKIEQIRKLLSSLRKKLPANRLAEFENPYLIGETLKITQQ